MNITVIGAGAWGTALAISLAAHHRVTLWARDAGQVAAMRTERCNRRYLPDVPLPAGLELGSDLSAALAEADLAIVAVPTAAFRSVLSQLAESPKDFGVLWLCKGFEAATSLLPHQVVAEVLPARFLRVRVGDTVEVTMRNDADSAMIHSVDFHATTGPGGGAAFLQVEPGGEKQLDFKALVPGLYVYHCATPMVAHHIANGMYGMILVEPEGGLSPVDREFYVMQGEIYTEAAFGQHGSQEFSVEKLLSEQPEYFVFNGTVGTLTKQQPLQAKLGETVRLYMGVGGPNFTSSFHVIGEIFDRVYTMGDLLSPPLRGIQTVTVAPGGAVAVEFKLEVPGRYLLVDHALSRLERGLLGFLMVDGPDQPDIYKPYDVTPE
jgi:copper-containing nitrite reductase